MMEYLSGAINGSSGTDNIFSVVLTNENDEPVKNVNAVLNIGKNSIAGSYDEENKCYWFTIPADMAIGSYLYNISVDGETLQFPDKIRFLGV